MSPKNMMWVSVTTLLISIATLALVWQMQKQMAHTNADAAETTAVGKTLQDRENGCSRIGGSWTHGEIVGSPGTYHCHLPSGGISNYDDDGTYRGTTYPK